MIKATDSQEPTPVAAEVEPYSDVIDEALTEVTTSGGTRLAFFAATSKVTSRRTFGIRSRRPDGGTVTLLLGRSALRALRQALTRYALLEPEPPGRTALPGFTVSDAPALDAAKVTP